MRIGARASARERACRGVRGKAPRERLEKRDRGDAGDDEQELTERAAADAAAVQVGNEIGHRDVEDNRPRTIGT